MEASLIGTCTKWHCVHPRATGHHPGHHPISSFRLFSCFRHSQSHHCHPNPATIWYLRHYVRLFFVMPWMPEAGCLHQDSTSEASLLECNVLHVLVLGSSLLIIYMASLTQYLYQLGSKYHFYTLMTHTYMFYSTHVPHLCGIITYLVVSIVNTNLDDGTSTDYEWGQRRVPHYLQTRSQAQVHQCFHKWIWLPTLSTWVQYITAKSIGVIVSNRASMARFFSL